MRSDTLVGSVVILLVATVVQRSIGFGRGVLFCRWLSPEALGEWDMTYSFLLLFAPLAVLGIPGSYGRYVEHYRQRGQLGIFLRRTTVWTAVSSVLAIAMLVVFAPQFSILVYGNGDGVFSIYAIAASLVAVILHHTLTSLLTALRLFRLVSVMNFVQSLLFAAIALAGLILWQNVMVIVGGYGIACLVASLGTLLWVWPGLRQTDNNVAEIPHLEFWKRLLRFAFFVWVTNLLSQMFAVVDRAMIMHCGNMSPSVALEQVGHYHSSRIVPLLLVSVADLLAGLIMPHLSHEWERGRRDEAGRLMNLSIKLTSLGMHAAGIGILLLGPFMFNIILQGRYTDGLAVLPWVLSGCVLSGVYLVAQNYLWCAEHPRLAAVPLAAGLALNALMNLLLVPMWGLYGAVLATAAATAFCLVTLIILSRRHGMVVDLGTWITLALPVSLGIGIGPAVGCLIVVVFLGATTHRIFDAHDCEKICGFLRSSLTRIHAMFPKLVPSGGTCQQGQFLSSKE
jgi:polysaccharide transporter, PST family